MSICYFESEKLFLLQTNATTYAFSIYEETPKYADATTRKTLRSLYWGKKIGRAEDLVRPFNWYINGYNDGGKHSHERYCSEFVGAGGLFYNEPTLKVCFADGVRDLFLNYKSHIIEDDLLKITLADIHYGLEVELVYRVFEEYDIIVRSCVIKNVGDDDIKIEKVFSATVNIPYGDKYYLTSMDSKWTHEYDLKHTEITKARTVIESLGGVSNSRNYPYFAIDDGNAGDSFGDVWYGTVAWSGNVKITVEKDAMEQVRVTGGISDDDFEWILKPGEEFSSPEFVGRKPCADAVSVFCIFIAPLNFDKFVFARAEAERLGRFYRVNTMARFDALDEMRLSGVVRCGVDEIDARLIYRHGICRRKNADILHTRILRDLAAVAVDGEVFHHVDKRRIAAEKVHDRLRRVRHRLEKFVLRGDIRPHLALLVGAPARMDARFARA